MQNSQSMSQPLLQTAEKPLGAVLPGDTLLCNGAALAFLHRQANGQLVPTAEVAGNSCCLSQPRRPALANKGHCVEPVCMLVSSEHPVRPTDVLITTDAAHSHQESRQHPDQPTMQKA